MKTCPVCFSEIKDSAIKCRFCLSFAKPRINEGQFWGTCLMVGGILIGVFCYIRYLSYLLGPQAGGYGSYSLTFLVVGIVLAYLGFLVFGFGTFLSWFISRPKDATADDKLEAGKKVCMYCGEIINYRAAKCRYCLSFLRQEKGKILATFVAVSGILIVTTAYILNIAAFRSFAYMKIGIVIIIAGILLFLFTVVRNRYSVATKPTLDDDMSTEV